MLLENDCLPHTPCGTALLAGCVWNRGQYLVVAKVGLVVRRPWRRKGPSLNISCSGKVTSEWELNVSSKAVYWQELSRGGFAYSFLRFENLMSGCFSGTSLRCWKRSSTRHSSLAHARVDEISVASLCLTNAFEQRSERSQAHTWTGLFAHRSCHEKIT